MRYLCRQGRRFTALVILAALLFSHSALAVAACVVHLHFAHEAIATHAGHGHGGQTHHDHDHGPAHGESLLCQIGCEAQAQSRDYVKTLEIPAPVAHKIQFVEPALPTLTWPARIERPRQYFSAAPPPLQLTILFSRFRN